MIDPLYLKQTDHAALSALKGKVSLREEKQEEGLRGEGFLDAVDVVSLPGDVVSVLMPSSVSGIGKTVGKEACEHTPATRAPVSSETEIDAAVNAPVDIEADPALASLMEEGTGLTGAALAEEAGGGFLDSVFSFLE